MAISAGFNAYIYGEVKGNPPFSGTNPFQITAAYDATERGIRNFPSGPTMIHPINPGVQITSGGPYVYSVIEVFPSGVQQYGKKFVTSTDVVTLATSRG